MFSRCVIFLLFAAVLSAEPAFAQAGGSAVDALNARVKSRADSMLGLLGLTVIPNETASTLSVDTGDPDETGYVTSQLGGAFTVSEEVPLYLEGFVGYTRYDPKFIFSGGTQTREVSAKWTGVAGTVGVGWDFRLADEIVLRPIANFSLGHMESDVSVAGRIIESETGRDLPILDGGRMDAYGYGGALMLDWERYLEAYEADAELRLTHIKLQSFDEFSDGTKAEADAITLGFWSRIRVPTGWTAFDGPVRGVGEFAAARFFGDQVLVLGSLYLLQVGGGLELDLAEVSWLPVERARFMARYVFGQDSLSGYSLGIGLTF
jgi:hypothetical protein